MNTDTYELVTRRIIAKLQAGTIPWKHFASSPLDEPKNLISKKPYRGINHFLLSWSKYGSEYWITYKQAQDLGGFVKKGEKGELIVFWRFLDVEDRETGETKQIPFLRHYYVWNVKQCAEINYTKLIEPVERISDPIEAAERIIANMPNPPRLVIDRTPKAYYSPVEDFVHMTERAACVSDSAYYDTLFHELSHATAHKRRLNRMEGDTAWCKFGSKPYANEELVAEMSSAMLCYEAGIFQETESNSSAYIASWLTRLENDTKLVVHAAAKAQKAADWILNRIEQHSEPQAQLAAAA